MTTFIRDIQACAAILANRRKSTPSRPRVRLTADYTDEQGLFFRAGQEGCVVGLLSGDIAAVEFDGYGEAREADRLQRERTGEGYNVVPWAGLIPSGLLQALPPSEG